MNFDLRRILIVFACLLSVQGGMAQQQLFGSYFTNLKSDGPVMGLGVSLTVIGFGVLSRSYPEYGAENIAQLDADDLLGFDRRVINNWSSSADKASTVVGLSTIALGGVSSVLMGRKGHDRGQIGLLYAEAMLVNAGLTEVMKRVMVRPRPYIYGSLLSTDEKLGHGSEGLKSFWSGHASNTACSAFFAAQIYANHHPESKARAWVWAGAATLTGVTGYLRVRAGQHFPSDVVVGSVVGGLIGYWLPKRRFLEPKDYNVFPVLGFSGTPGLMLVIRC